MPLSSSFWVDEAATAFVVHHGATDPSLAVAPQVPASIYYALPKAAERVFGFSEAVYRLPSLLVMLAGLCVIGRIGRALIHPAAGWMVVSPVSRCAASTTRPPTHGPMGLEPVLPLFPFGS